MRWNKISDAVVRRLPLYLRVLDELVNTGDVQLISSHELGQRAGVGSALVRKDLAWFGEFGKQGVGYEVEFLRNELLRILNLDQPHKVVLVGVGSLGVALTRYNVKRFQEDESFNLKIVGLFDNDSEKVGAMHEDIEVKPFSKMEQFIIDEGVQMAIITVPAASAQDVAARVVKAGVGAILNFAPVKLELPDHVKIASADLTLELQRLAYYLEDK